jgi:uncharacterized protein YjlB
MRPNVSAEAILFTRSEWVPNNPTLPVLLYRHAPEFGDHTAEAFEARFRQNGWQGMWRNGVFSYQHYHTHAHEALGIASGRARLLIGGPTGQEIDVTAGDCLVLPAGTGHCLIHRGDEFLVVGAYPPGQHADICTEAPGQVGLDAIEAVALPETDPLQGRHGPLRQIWHGGTNE